MNVPTALAAPDKFRGTVTAAEAAAAIANGAAAAGWSCLELPLADGGEGTLDVLGGANRTSTVAGPLGAAVDAGWQLDGTRAVLEAARASGLTLAGGAARNDAVAASSRGTGELIAAAIDAGARDILVCVGGTATTDGGLGAVEAIGDLLPLERRGVAIRVACDVETRFLDAATVFAPQKGAGAEEVALLTARLHALADRYRRDFGIDVTELTRAGAGGGLAGGLAAVGAVLHGGFATVAEAAGLDGALDAAAAVVTGEGFLDATSFAGKVVGGVVARARARGRRTIVIAGDVASELGVMPATISLVDRFGADRAWTDARACIAEATAHALRRFS